MSRIGRIPTTVLIMSIAAFVGWGIAFRNNEWLHLIGVNALQVIAGALCFFWLYQAYRKTKDSERKFWLLLSIGVLFHLSSNVIWLYSLFFDQTTVTPDSSYVTWLAAFLFFLVALIYITKQLSTSFSHYTYLFNIIVFMVTAVAISIHYLIRPILEHSEGSWLVSLITAAFPIADLSIIFVSTILYYLVVYNEEKELLLFVIFGFFLQIIGDSLYTYLSVYGSYQLGGFVDLIWLVALLFIGFAGYHAQKTKKEITLVVKNPFEEREFIFPYSSIMVLLALVIYSYRWNFNWLSSALLIIFFMVLGRQLLVINRNNKLVKEYRHLAYHDPLTGLNNRASFTETVENSLKKHKTDKMALLLIDLDRFKVVNDTLGHLVGDQILIKTADRLRQALGEEASLFRLGGDEFVIIISDTTEKECSVTAEHLLKNFQEPFSVGDYEINVTPSIGISIYPDHGVNSEDLLKNADAAMYTAKENGKNNFSFYNSELNSIMTRKLKIENELRKAIESEQFILHYQPKVDLPTKRFIGMEALLRWEHPELGWITPGEFIPIAEETGQIVSIGEWVLKEACKQNKTWQENGFSPLCVSVNVSVLQFQQDDFLLTVKEALEESGLEPQFLELEITESIMQNIRESVKILESLKAMGIKTSIDDFGTGYSSLNILQELPIDTIKIDKSFIDGIGSTNQQAMVKTIIDLGVNLNLTVVAEGIESEQQMEALIHSNCNIGQGFLFSRAVAPEDFENILKVNNMKLEKV